MGRCLTLLLLFFATIARSQTPLPAALPNVLPAADSKVLYVGRVDHDAPGGPRAQWPGTEIRLRFRGTAIQITLTDTGLNRYTLIIDDREPTMVGSSDSRCTVDLAKDLPPGDHRVSLFRSSGAGGGIVQFHTFATDGQWLQPRPRKRRIEIIGDSISAGTGDEGTAGSDLINMHNTNAFLAYGCVAARRLGADYTCLAIRNRRMAKYGFIDHRPHKVPGDTLPEMYDRALPSDPASRWSFPADAAPDAVVINLSTNDFFTTGFDEREFVQTYEHFLNRIRRHYPAAAIYLTDSPLLDDAGDNNRHDLSKLRGLLDHIAHDSADPRVHIFLFDRIEKSDGKGAGWHPSVATHAKMAEKLVETLKHDLGW